MSNCALVTSARLRSLSLRHGVEICQRLSNHSFTIMIWTTGKRFLVSIVDGSEPYRRQYHGRLVMVDDRRCGSAFRSLESSRAEEARCLDSNSYILILRFKAIILRAISSKVIPRPQYFHVFRKCSFLGLFLRGSSILNTKLHVHGTASSKSIVSPAFTPFDFV